jgi:diguanylate cyclase (GGDEF)-like protein
MEKLRSLGAVLLLSLASCLLAGTYPTAALASEINLATTLCHAVSERVAEDDKAPPAFACSGEPGDYQSGTLWLRADLRRSAVDGKDLVLFVHNSRFDRLSVMFTYADGSVAREQVQVGRFGSHWRAGGQIAFEAPMRDAPVVTAILRFDKLASAHLLRMRLMGREQASYQATALSGTIAGALTLLLIGALYNAGLAFAVRRGFPAWQAAWAGCMVLWGAIWSQFHLFAFPRMAGPMSAQICTALSCLAVTLATVSAVTAIDRAVLPVGLRRIALLLGAAVTALGLPLAIMRIGPIVEMANLLGVLILADLALVAICLALASWRKSADARALVGAWSLPMLVLAVVQLMDINALFWGGGAQILILFAAAWQTLWLSITASHKYAKLRIDRDSARVAEAQAQELARRDPLTGLLNRRGFVEVLEARSRQILDLNAPFALLLIDVDRFKRINDKYGHDAGDLVLTTIASRIARWEGPMCSVARLGGEEFVLVIGELEGFALRRFAEGVREGIAACRHERMYDLVVTVSIGVAQTTGRPDFQTLYRFADEALYSAKRSGRNRVAFNKDGDDRNLHASRVAVAHHHLED